MATLMDNTTAEKLLNFTNRLDIDLLDNVVNAMYTSTGEQQKFSQQLLTTLKEHPEAWTRVDAILEYSKNQQTKYYALQILEQVIKTRWKAIPRNQCEGIKKFIVAIIIKTSQDSAENERVYLNKLNMILVQILKREWPKQWPTFIPDIVGASKTNELLCLNNMSILKLLSEEVFDFSSGQITQTKAKHLKDTMCQEFSQIFHLCEYVMENSANPGLIVNTLETLLRFLNWIPLGYIFETELIGTLTKKFLNVPLFRNITLKCITEIAAVTVTNYDPKFIQLFSQTMMALEVMVPLNINIRDAYSQGGDKEQQFIQNLAMFLCTFLKEHGHLVESQIPEMLGKALQYLSLISEVEEVEIFKITLEYWNSLSADLYRETPFPTSTPLFLQTTPMASPSTQRREFYAPLLSRVRYTIVSRMAKPEEVLVVENEHGEVVREFMKDTDSINLYKNMRETLVYLTHLDCPDTERIMTKKLQNQVNGTEWSWKNLNTLCWAIGSISGAMHEEDEKRFIVTVIKDLLGLCEQKKGKDNKAIIASNIMYVVGQYPRFLRAHWKFLKTVVNKLFEFMHETHEGVQDMACDTFIKIAQKCRRHFVTVQMGEMNPFIEEILSTTSTIICDLQPQQVHTFYEAVGYMISAQNDTGAQEILIEKYMQLPNSVWDEIISQAALNVNILKDPEAVRQLGSIIKTNIRACKSLGHSYVVQLGRIYLDMLNVYKVMSDNITESINLNPESVKQPIIKSMRVVKKETLKLISTWIGRCNNAQMVLENFIPPLLEALLVDYRIGIPGAREPEVLQAMAVIVNKLEGGSVVAKIFDAVFECTLEMINKDFQEWPEHRIGFYSLLQAVVCNNFQSLLTINPQQFKLVLDSIIWAIKHTMRNVADTGLSILLQLLQSMGSLEQKHITASFYSTYFLDIIQHIFSVVTDTSHTASLSMHATILAYLFSIVEMGQVSLGEASIEASITRLQNFVAELLKTAFPHLTENQLKVTVQGFVTLNQDVNAFKEHLRDFIVQIREFTGADDTDLYLEEREALLLNIQKDKRKIQMSVPGIINPHEINEEEMQD